MRLECAGPAFARDIWLVVHRDLRHSAPVRAVLDFVARVVSAEPALRLPAAAALPRP